MSTHKVDRLLVKPEPWEHRFIKMNTESKMPDNTVVCCNYDCQTEFAKIDAFYDDERPYCSYDCAFNHYYDLKKERRRNYYVTVAK
jgi:hypothetical protein